MHSKYFTHSLPSLARGLPVCFFNNGAKSSTQWREIYFSKKCGQPKQKGRKSQKITLKGLMGFYVQSKSIKLLRKCRRTSWEEGQGNELLGATPNMWPIQGDTVRLDSLELKKKSACMTDKGMKRKKLWAGGNGLEVTYLTEVWFLKYVVSRGWDVAQGVRGCLCQMEPELDRVFSMQVSPAEPGCVPACNPSTGGKNRRFLELLAG